MVYGIKPQRHRAHGGRTNGDYYYRGANWAGLFKVIGMIYVGGQIIYNHLVI